MTKKFELSIDILERELILQRALKEAIISLPEFMEKRGYVNESTSDEFLEVRVGECIEKIKDYQEAIITLEKKRKVLEKAGNNE